MMGTDKVPFWRPTIGSQCEDLMMLRLSNTESSMFYNLLSVGKVQMFIMDVALDKHSYVSASKYGSALLHWYGTGIFALDLSGNRSGVTILCLQHPLKVSGTTLTIHYKITTIPIGTFSLQKTQDLLEF